MTDNSGQLKEAIEVLKKLKHWIDYGAGELEPTANTVMKAIDTVVAVLEKPFPTDEEIYYAGNEHYIFGKNDPIGSRHRSIYESRRESFILGAIWMRDLIQERSKK